MRNNLSEIHVALTILRAMETIASSTNSVKTFLKKKGAVEQLEELMLLTSVDEVRKAIERVIEAIKKMKGFRASTITTTYRFVVFFVVWFFVWFIYIF